MVTAFPPDKGRLSEYADVLVRKLSSDLSLPIEIFGDSVSPSSRSVRIRRVWRPNSSLSILKLWMLIAFSTARLMFFNLHMAVFGSARLTNFLGLMSPLIARITGKKVVTTLHNIPDMMNVGLILKLSLPTRIGMRLAARFVVLGSHVIVVTTESYTKLLKKTYGARVVRWIPHGAYFTDVEPTWTYSGRGKVLFLGYIARYKALRELAESVGILRHELPDAELLVVGEPHPNFREEGTKILKELTALPWVRLLGRMEDESLPGLVKEIDVAVLPYLTSTGTSGVLHLLSGLGVPFIVSDTPEFREMRAEGAGVLLAPSEPSALASAISRVIKDRSLAEELSKRSRHFAEGRSWEKVALAYAEIFRELNSSLSSARRGRNLLSRSPVRSAK